MIWDWLRPRVRFAVLEGGMLPAPATDGAAGFDLVAPRIALIAPNDRVLLDLRVAAAIPRGYVGLVCSRSGLANQGVTVVNQPGVIDSDYRGAIKVLLQWAPCWTQRSMPHYRVETGQRIAQLVVVPCLIRMTSVNCLDETDRGSGGFGSTGK